jgi:ribosome-associated toxin RatA of RatAB toxin-antitoxin module
MLAGFETGRNPAPDMEIKRTALVLHSAMDMFRLVRDVPSYPEFLSWCVGARVHEQDAQGQLASLVVRISGVEHKFTTRNRFVPAERLTLSLVDGPFSHLSGEWQFKALGDAGSKVILTLNFGFSNSLLSSAFRSGFARVADRLVSDFGKRADVVYGS